MGGSCCDKDCEHEDNDLFIAWMKHTSKIPRLHGKCCHDKCGCYDPKHCNLNQNYFNNRFDNQFNNKIQLFVSS